MTVLISRCRCFYSAVFIAETGVQNTPLMITTVGLAFKGCDQEAALIFLLTASLYYVVNSLWYVIVLRCVFAKWCDRTFADDEAQCCANLKYLCCADCPCCLKRTYVQREADPVEASLLSSYSGTDFKTTDGTACLPIRLSQAGITRELLLLLMHARLHSLQVFSTTN